MKSDALSTIAIALVGSPITAIAAELAAQRMGYPEMLAIARRGCVTSLPVVPDASDWVDRMKYPRLLGMRAVIKSFESYVEDLVGGRSFDCYIHHRANGFSQVLSTHPLCRKYFYIEEGLTAMVGGRMGRSKQRRFKKMLWRLRSFTFYGGRIDKSREFFDVRSPNYGGACAVSQNAFKDFPKRIQLSYSDLESTVAAPADVTIFLDSQYIIGHCSEESYVNALTGCLRAILNRPSSVAVKFHPAERDRERKRRILESVENLEGVKGLAELPPAFIGERMAFDPEATMVVGTSSLGIYLGEKGFRTFTFAPRLISTSPNIERVMREMPPEFERLCRSA